MIAAADGGEDARVAVYPYNVTDGCEYLMGAAPSLNVAQALHDFNVTGAETSSFKANITDVSGTKPASLEGIEGPGGIVMDLICPESDTWCFLRPQTALAPSRRQLKSGKGKGSKSSKSGEEFCIDCDMFLFLGSTGCKKGLDVCVCIDFNACFSEKSTVEVKDKGTTSMKDLKIGDKVLAANGEYKPVYSFFHRHESKPSFFFQIHLVNSPASQRPLEMTAEHLVFLAGKKDPVPAWQVKVGDTLVLHTADESSPKTSAVSKIKMVKRDGIYAPATTDGTIVVNGVLASSFVTFQGSDSIEIGGYKVMSCHFFERVGEIPHRLYCAIFGTSGLCMNETYDEEEGLTEWSSFAMDIVKKWLDLDSPSQAVTFVALMAILLPLYIVEMLILTPGAMITIISIICTWLYLKNRFTATFKAVKTVE